MSLLNSTLPGEIPPPPPDPNASRCHLLGTTGLIVQFIMGILVLASLVVKRQFERRKRPWRIWVWDVSKQLAGQAVVHGLNVLISNVVADAADNNPCSLYFLNILIDTTVGVLIFYITLKALTWFLTERLGKEGFVSGQYGNPPRPKFWWKQLMPYLASMIFMKLLVVLPLTLPHISTALLRFGHAMLEYLNPQVQIVFVMAVFPVIMNIIQFCIFDQIIKAGKANQEGDEDEDKEDDDGGYRRIPTGDIEDGRGSTSRSFSRSFSNNRDRRRRGSSVKGIDSRSTTPVPRSPLLEASSLGSKKDYGSTSPSPRLSGDGGAGTAGTFWQNMLSARQTSNGGAAASTPRSLSTSPNDSRLGASSSATATATRDDWRSGAPSPESFRPDPDGIVPPIELSPNSDVSASPPASMETSAHSHFGHVSRLSEDLGREARKQLSPRSRTSMASVMVSAVGLRDLPS